MSVRRKIISFMLAFLWYGNYEFSHYSKESSREDKVFLVTSKVLYRRSQALLLKKVLYNTFLLAGFINFDFSSNFAVKRCNAHTDSGARCENHFYKSALTYSGLNLLF